MLDGPVVEPGDGGPGGGPRVPPRPEAQGAGQPLRLQGLGGGEDPQDPAAQAQADRVGHGHQQGAAEGRPQAGVAR